jgi:dTDP-4-dehydrorhamnose reductase
MKNVLVIGASGQVGGCILDQLSKLNINAVGTYNSVPVDGLLKLNIGNYDDVKKLISDIKPDTIFVPASLTNVDYCEQNKYEAFNINVVGLFNIEIASLIYKSKIVYFSSDYVFDGNCGPYDESSPCKPINEYGHQKCDAENEIKHIANSLIIRTSSVYGFEKQRKNFVCRVIDVLRQGGEIFAATDEMCTPTYKEDLVEQSINLVLNDKAGLYHIAGSEVVSRYELALEVAKVFSLNEKLIVPVKSADCNRTAKRPLKAGLITISDLPRLKSFRECLLIMKEKEKCGY